MEEIIIQNIGRVYTFLPFLKSLKIGETIGEYVQDQGDIEIGRVAEILILNRACGFNTPLYRISEWAENHGIEKIYGCPSKKLNDDRIGAVLDKLYDKMSDLDVAISLKMVKIYDLDISRIHFDPSSFPITGEVLPRAGEEAPKAKYGRSPEGHCRKQMHFAMAVSGEGSIPLIGNVYDGNTNDPQMHPEEFKRLQKIAKPSDFLLVNDSKFDCNNNLKDVLEHHGKFLCPGIMSVRQQDIFLNLLKKGTLQWVELEYASKKDLKKPKSKRQHYKAFESADSINCKIDGQSQKCEYRLIYVHSSQNARQEKKTRNKYIGKISYELEQIKNRLNKDKYRQKNYIEQKIHDALRIYPSVGKMFKTNLSKRNKKFIFEYELDFKEVERSEKFDGVYLLKTNLDKKEYPIEKVLPTYKKQSRIEDRIKAIKGPLGLSPMFLKLPKHIAALFFIILQALKLYCLLEYETRKELQKNGDPIPILPEGRKTLCPTGETILRAFDYGINIIKFSKNNCVTTILTKLNDIQKKIFQLLSIPLMDLRSLSRKFGKMSPGYISSKGVVNSSFQQQPVFS